MGLFGKGFDEKAALLGFFSPQAGQMYSSRKRSEEARKAEAARQARLIAVIDADERLSPQEKAFARDNLDAFEKLWSERMAPRQFGPGGGSVYTPGGQNGGQWNMAPSRHEYQGSVYDVAGGAPGQKATVTPQHEATQWVTPQPGTTAFGVNSFSGLPRTGAGTAAPAAPQPGPTPGTVEDGHVFNGGDPADPANWTPLPQGGAGFTAPRMFPGPY